MKYYYKTLALLFALTILTTSCRDNDLNFDYDSKPLSKLLESAPIKKIDLDEAPITILTPDSTDIYGKERADSDSLLLGLIANAISVDNNILILDRAQNAVLTTDKNGFIASKIYTPGRGPGEFGQLGKIFSNKSGIYLYDSKNSKIHFYDKNWNFVKSLTLKNSLGRTTYEASNKYLFLPSEVTNDNIVQILNSSPPFEEKGSLLPRLIPFGMQPLAYNSAKIKGNNNIIVAIYSGLPFLFIFDNELNHIKTLYFTSKKINSIENPPLKAVPEKKGSGIGVQSFILGFEVLNNDDLILSLGKEVYYLSANSNLDYELISASHLLYANKEKQERDGYGINAKHIDQDSDYILVSSITEDKAYKFHLEDLRKRN